MKRGNSSDGEDWMLFVAADHLNDITNHNMKPLEMTKLNLQVGEKAVKVSAFAPASTYLRRGIEALEAVDSPWEHHYALSFRIFQAAADAEFCLGHYDQGAEYCQLVIKRSRSDLERLHAQFSLAVSLGRQNRHAESMEVHATALCQVGEFPKHFRKIHALINYGKIAGHFKKCSDYDIMLLPPMTDRYKLAVMDHLERMSIRAYHCSNLPVVMLCIQKSIRMSFKHGISLDTAQALASYGMILFGPSGNHKLGSRLAKLALDIVQSIEKIVTAREKALACQVLFTVNLYVASYSKPLSQVLENLQESQRLGFESGDFESAYRAWGTTNVTAYVAGLSLHSIEENNARMHQQLVQYKVIAILALNTEFRFALHHLSGKASDSLDWEQFEKFSGDGDEESETFTRVWFYWSRLQLAYYFRKYEIADKLIAPFRTHGAIDTSYTVTSLRVFFSGLTAGAMARKTGKNSS
jgi:predicted ATPase